MSRRQYTFTAMAAQDVAEIAERSRAKWGEPVADKYLDDLEEGAA